MVGARKRVSVQAAAGSAALLLPPCCRRHATSVACCLKTVCYVSRMRCTWSAFTTGQAGREGWQSNSLCCFACVCQLSPLHRFASAGCMAFPLPDDQITGNAQRMLRLRSVAVLGQARVSMKPQRRFCRAALRRRLHLACRSSAMSGAVAVRSTRTAQSCSVGCCWTACECRCS